MGTTANAPARRRVVFGDARCDRPSHANLTALLRDLTPGLTRNAREHIAYVIRLTAESGTLVGVDGLAVSWRWVGGAVELEVESS